MKMKWLLAGAMCLGSLTGAAGQDFDGDIELRFERFDKDSDGRIRADELPGKGLLFRKIDGDGDGSITMDELFEFSQRQRVAVDGERPEPTIIEKAIPREAPVTADSCRAAAEYSARAKGYSVLVKWDGETLFEQYDNGWGEGTAHRLASGTKSFAGVLAAAAVEDGIFKGFDEKVSDTITEWQDDERLRDITVRQLLTLTSGLDVGDNGQVPSLEAAVRGAKAKHDPGAKFEYGPVPFQVFGEVMRRKLKGRHEVAYAYLDERILEPVGVHVTYWRTDDDKQRHVPSGAFLTAREWVKFGEFLRLGGKAGGDQVVGSELLAGLMKGTKANPGYGTAFWLLGKGKAKEEVGEALGSLLEGGYMAAGAGKQRLYVLPALKLVVVRQGETEGRGFDNAKFLGLLLGTVEP